MAELRGIKIKEHLKFISGNAKGKKNPMIPFCKECAHLECVLINTGCWYDLQIYTICTKVRYAKEQESFP